MTSHIGKCKPYVTSHIGKCKFCLFVCLFVAYQRPCLAHAGYIGTDRSLLRGHNALLLQQVARDPLHALSHRREEAALRK